MNLRPPPYHGGALPLSYIGIALIKAEFFIKRAEDETRTRDPQLGRLMLYQLSYFRNYLVMTVGVIGFEPIQSKHQIYSLARLSNSGAPPPYLTSEPVDGFEPPTR